MRRSKLIIICLLSVLTCLSFAQSAIDRPTYVNKYRTKGAFLREPIKRTAKKLSEPVYINDFLWVYPIDLGYFTSHPNDLIAQINAQNTYGRNNWRIPTSEELMVMEDNASTIGMGDGIYMAKSHSNGILRLVSFDGVYCVNIGGTYWQYNNLGAKRLHDIGSVVSYEDAIRLCPSGYRLPTKIEYEVLIFSKRAYFEMTGGDCNKELYFPIGVCQIENTATGATARFNGSYFIQDNEYSLYFSVDAHGKNIVKPKISSGGLSKGMVRYVLDK